MRDAAKVFLFSHSSSVRLCFVGKGSRALFLIIYSKLLDAQFFFLFSCSDFYYEMLSEKNEGIE